MKTIRMQRAARACSLILKQGGSCESGAFLGGLWCPHLLPGNQRTGPRTKMSINRQTHLDWGTEVDHCLTTMAKRTTFVWGHSWGWLAKQSTLLRKRSSLDRLDQLIKQLGARGVQPWPPPPLVSLAALISRDCFDLHNIRKKQLHEMHLVLCLYMSSEQISTWEAFANERLNFLVYVGNLPRSLSANVH